MIKKINIPLGNQRTEGFDYHTRIAALGEDQACGGYVEAQAEQGRYQQQGGEDRELQRLRDAHGDHQNHDGNGNVQYNQDVQRLLGQRHHQKENDDHDQQRYGVVQYPSHSSPRLLLSRRYFSFSSMR